MDTPPDSLKQTLSDRGLIPKNALWSPLRGGRSNYSWHVETSKINAVCKLYPRSSNNPLFPNLAGSEFAALNALKGFGIAPEPIQLLNSVDGLCLLYGYIDGETWSTALASDIIALAQTLHVLHRTKPPSMLAEGPPIASKLLLQGQKILSLCAEPSVAEIPPPPDLPYIAEVSPVFLHGDLVPANILKTAEGIKFIDWQCPSLGDPCEDISVFLSPAMRLVNAVKAPSKSEADALLEVYGGTEIKRRYALLAPLFHWRMSAYCLWKIEQGAIDYKPALEAELEALDSAQLYLE